MPEHRAALRHGNDPHGFGVVQVSPDQTFGQRHRYEFPVIAQVPPFWQGSGVQGVFSQLSPEKPSGHVHEYVVSEVSEQTPLFWHGIVPHGCSCSQVSPVHPIKHPHENVESEKEHVPPFLHGSGVQGVTSHVSPEVP